MNTVDKTMSILALIAALSVIVIIIAFTLNAPSHKETNDAQAKCESLKGTFSRPSLKCFVNGQEVQS